MSEQRPARSPAPSNDSSEGSSADGAGTRPELSYEEAREELIEVVRRLESGGSNLEESLALWERGEKLAQVCQSWLDGAKKRLDAALGKDPAAS